jgi:hypothetical protein
MRETLVLVPARVVVACALLLASGCAGGATAPQTLQATQPQAQSQSIARPSSAVQSVAEVVPDSTVKSKTETINAAGGIFKLPALPTLKGQFGYPSSNAQSGSKVAISVSLTNAFGAPTPKGATIVYFVKSVLDAKQLEIAFNSGTEKASISGTLLDPTKTYTLYVYVPAFSKDPVDTIAIGMPNSKHQLSFTSPFSGVTLPTNTTVDIELGY